MVKEFTRRLRFVAASKVAGRVSAIDRNDCMKTDASELFAAGTLLSGNFFASWKSFRCRTPLWLGTTFVLTPFLRGTPFDRKLLCELELSGGLEPLGRRTRLERATR